MIFEIFIEKLADYGILGIMLGYFIYDKRHQAKIFGVHFEKLIHISTSMINSISIISNLNVKLLNYLEKHDKHLDGELNEIRKKYMMASMKKLILTIQKYNS